LLIVCLPLAYYVVATPGGLAICFSPTREKAPGSFYALKVSVLKAGAGRRFLLRRMKISQVFLALQDYPKLRKFLFCVNDSG